MSHWLEICLARPLDGYVEADDTFRFANEHASYVDRM